MRQHFAFDVANFRETIKFIHRRFLLAPSVAQSFNGNIETYLFFISKTIGDGFRRRINFQFNTVNQTLSNSGFMHFRREPEDSRHHAFNLREARFAVNSNPDFKRILSGQFVKLQS